MSVLKNRDSNKGRTVRGADFNDNNIGYVRAVANGTYAPFSMGDPNNGPLTRIDQRRAQRIVREFDALKAKTEGIRR
ncbi:Uncharacterised protein [uncultured archaeon]|nr:Uncharacterised protein [uncultured archaeon]